jgi:hypothetical protein
MRKAGLPAVALERRVESSLTQIFTSWNRMAGWLRQIEGLRRAG